MIYQKLSYFCCIDIKTMTQQEKEIWFANYEKQSAERRWFLDYVLNEREMLKYINQKLGGKLTGQSKTTMSLYSRLSSGYTVRVSDHAAIAKRSKTSINIIVSKNRPYIYVNERLVELNWEEAYKDHTVLYDAVIAQVNDELEYLIDWAA